MKEGESHSKHFLQPLKKCLLAGASGKGANVMSARQSPDPAAGGYLSQLTLSSTLVQRDCDEIIANPFRE